MKTIKQSEMKELISDFIGFDFVSISEFDRSSAELGYNLKWSKIIAWEEKGDLQIYQEIDIQNQLKGQVFISIEENFPHSKKLSPYSLNAENVPELIENYQEKYGGCFFNGDTVLLCPQGSVCLIFSIDGYFAILKK